MINTGLAKRFEEVMARTALASTCTVLLVSSLGVPLCQAAPATKSTAEKKADKKTDGKDKKESKPEPVIENVQNVTTDQLVDRPHEYLNKNIKFEANFHAFSSIALDYKPAMRASRNYLSFLVLRPNSKIPYSELKLAMPIPKDKDPLNAELAALKEGDTLEITGKEFATALDEPWVDVLRMKKIASAPSDKKEAAEDGDKKSDDKKSDVDKKSDDKKPDASSEDQSKSEKPGNATPPDAKKHHLPPDVIHHQ